MATLVESDDFVVVAHVHNQSHFVLLTGYEAPDTFYCNDPFYNTTSYLYSDIHDILLYNIQAASRKLANKLNKIRV
jgi:hypothetical protein